MEELKKEGVKVVDAVERFAYGKFVHILDVEDNVIKLWEPEDMVYDEIVEGRSK